MPPPLQSFSIDSAAGVGGVDDASDAGEGSSLKNSLHKARSGMMKMTSKIFRQVSIASHFEIGRNINEKTEVEHQIEKLCVKKAELSNSRLAFLGMLSGIWMVMAASFANLLASGSERSFLVSCHCSA